MKELREILDFGKLRIIHEGKDKSGNSTMNVLTQFARAGVKTANGHLYTQKILEKEIERLQPLIEKGGFIGSGDHNEKGFASIGDASHRVTKMWIDKDGKAMAELKILPTIRGKNVQELIKGGVRLGVSTTGPGSASKSGEILSDWRMTSLDIVTNPAASVAVFDKSNIFESVNFEKTEEEKIAHKQALIDAHHRKARDEAFGGEGENKMKSNEEYIQECMKVFYTVAKKEEGFKGTFEEWKADGGEVITRAACAYNAGEFPSMNEALKAQGSPKIVEKMVIENQKIDPRKYASEASLFGMTFEEYAKRINASIGENVKAVNTGWSAEERKRILSEAGLAGRDISTPEARLKILNETVVIETDKETLFEKEIVAQHKALTEDGENVTLESVREVMKIDREKKQEEEAKRGRIQTYVRERLLAGPNQILKNK